MKVNTIFFVFLAAFIFSMERDACPMFTSKATKFFGKTSKARMYALNNQHHVQIGNDQTHNQVLDILHKTSFGQNQTHGSHLAFQIVEYRSRPGSPETTEVTVESWNMIQESWQRFQEASPETRKMDTYTYSISWDQTTGPTEGVILDMFEDLKDATIKMLSIVRVVTVIVSQGHMVGFIAYYIKDGANGAEPYGYIQNIFVNPQFQRMKVGQFLMYRGYLDCVNHSVNCVRCIRPNRDDSLDAFFVKCGFHTVPITPNFFKYEIFLKEDPYDARFDYVKKVFNNWILDPIKAAYDRFSTGYRE